MIQTRSQLQACVEAAVNRAQIIDLHTHLFNECFGKLFLYGIDELLTYHYLVAETFRYADISHEEFYSLSKSKQADIVWKALFVDNTPISEAARSIIVILKKLGLDTDKDLEYYRSYFASVKPEKHVDNLFKIMNIKYVVMTNDPFDDYERSVWLDHYVRDERFKAALRLDVLLNSCEDAFEKLNSWGYKVGSAASNSLTGAACSEIRRFLAEWVDQFGALYCAVSLPPDFVMNDGSLRAAIIENCVLPVCREKNLAFALMIGVRRGINPKSRLAGDSLGKADIKALEYLCAGFPENKFMVTMLSAENQHELIVTTRKFSNLMLFGCWWFQNIPSQIESITRMRLELLGTSFIPQHSDCRVLEQLISKWTHSRTCIARVLVEKYSDLMDDGYPLKKEQIKQDVAKLFSANFERFVKASR